LVRAATTLIISDNDAPPPDDYDGTEYAPVAQNDYFYANFEQPSSFSPGPGDTVLANDFEYLSRPLTITGYSLPSHGTLSFDSSTGRFTYVPHSSFNGQDSFTYQISNGRRTATATVYLANSVLLDANSHLLVRDPAPAAPAAAGWNVARRSDLRWARVQSVNPATDTFEDLATRVGLEANQIANWLSWEDPHQPGKLTPAQNQAIRDALRDPKKTVQAVFGNQRDFWVPNTILSYWGGELGQLGRHWERWNPEMKTLVDRGYFVEYAGYRPRAAVQVNYRNDDLLERDPTQWWRNYNRLVAEANFKAVQEAGTVEDPWTRDQFLQYMEDRTKNRSLYGIYSWGHGWKAGKDKDGKSYSGGLVLNPKATEANIDQYALPYDSWKAKLAYSLGAGFLYSCFSAAAKTNDPTTSVFARNGIFWGSETILVFNLALPFLQKWLRARMPDVQIGVGEARLTLNPPLIERVFNQNREIQ
jgi:hypothetical protein